MQATKKLKLNWVTKEHNIAGNALGYNVHNSNMKKYSEEYFDYDDDADIALHIVPADLFKPIKGKINVLFTMWEFLDVPNNYIRNLYRADAVIVPCGFCRDIFRNYVRSDLYVCHEGINSNNYPFHKRENPIPLGKKFRFLWVGASNPRKGYPVVLEAVRALEKYPNIEIYLKTTQQGFNRKNYVTKLWKNRRELKAQDHETYKEMLNRAKLKQDFSNKLIIEGQHKNIIWDSRRLSQEELSDLYNSAHCFLFPTFGEGWGLTLCEAMATGLPSIATNITGCKEYFGSNVGYEIKYKLAKQKLENYDIIANGHIPDVNDFFNKMIHVMNNYDRALQIGKSASEKIHSKFTWERSAKRLNDIITDIYNKKVNS